MKKLFLSAIAMLVASCAPAHAVDGEIGIGVTHFGAQRTVYGGRSRSRTSCA